MGPGAAATDARAALVPPALQPRRRRPIHLVVRLRTLLASALGIALSATTADAYQLKTTAGGDPVRWPAGAVDIDLSLGGGPAHIRKDRATAAAVGAFDAWAAELAPWVEVRIAPPESSPLPTAADALNVVRWVVDEDDPERDPEALATALVTYRTADGAITDADIVINAVDHGWTVAASGCAEVYDLQNVLAHEVGHFLGLSHEAERREATMYPRAGRCEVTKRDLDDDDRDAIATLYGAMPSPEQALAGCSAGGASGGAAGLVLVLLATAALRRRSGARLGLLALALGWPAAADAGVVRALTVAEMGERSALVVEGRVVGQRVHALGDRIVTDVTVSIAACWIARSPCPTKVVVRQPGGELGEVGQWVSTSVPLATGEQVVLFLRERGGVSAPVGLGQGVFKRVVVGAQPVLIRDLSDVSRVGAAPAPGPGVELWRPLELAREAASGDAQ